MSVKVSIVIPVYNSQKYLRECLESCIKQTLNDIEIIIVNDASTDSSGLIIDEYERNYPSKIKAIHLKKNLHQGGARNRGILIAKGEYINFVDSDDIIATDMCEKLYNTAKKEKAEIVYCDILREAGNGQCYSGTRFLDGLVGDVNAKTIPGIIMQQRNGPVAHLIHRKILIQKECLFPENIYCEDCAITKLWDLKAKKISKVNEVLYFYRRNLQSTDSLLSKSYHNDGFQGARLLADNLKSFLTTDNYRWEIEIICVYFSLEYLKGMVGRYSYTDIVCLNRDFKLFLQDTDYGDNPYLVRWFTPAERDILDNGLFSKFQYTIEDYKQYYLEIKSFIDCCFDKLKLSGKIAVWSNTKYAKAFQSIYPDMRIIDGNSCRSGESFDIVIVLRSSHCANVKKYFGEKKILDLQSVLLGITSMKVKNGGNE